MEISLAPNRLTAFNGNPFVRAYNAPSISTCLALFCTSHEITIRKWQ